MHKFLAALQECNNQIQAMGQAIGELTMRLSAAYAAISVHAKIINLLKDKGLLTNEEIETAINQGTEQTPADGGPEDAEGDFPRGSSEPGVLPDGGDFGNQIGERRPSDATPDAGEVLGAS